MKRVLSNVKTRGGWGEVQLETLLSDLLTPGQYAKNVQTHPESRERVEFAIRTPGQIVDGMPCWIPIDAKFPLQDWERLQVALEHADVAAADAARKALADFLRAQAKSIREKYIRPPYTTDFAILFLPTEALYAEMLSRPGFVDALQREFRIVLTGPTILAALLNSLQMGFRTLAGQPLRPQTCSGLLLALRSSPAGEYGPPGALPRRRTFHARRDRSQGTPGAPARRGRPTRAHSAPPLERWSGGPCGGSPRPAAARGCARRRRCGRTPNRGRRRSAGRRLSSPRTARRRGGCIDP